MGDRILIQVTRKPKSGPVEFSPIAYGHWMGASAPEILTRLKERMKDRTGDVTYTFARLLQEMAAEEPEGALSLGCWNAEQVLTSEASHGDAGVVLVDVSNGFRCVCLGGYLSTGPDGLPVRD
jgi:hypothetical protein